MRVRRVTLEVEVPWEVPAADVLLVVGPTLDRLAGVHQAQVVKDERSPNTRIGRAWKAPQPGLTGPARPS